MSNPTVPAAAECMPANDATLDELLTAFLAEIRMRTAIHAAYQAARASIPEWAQPGPRLLMGDGSFSKETTGWPRVEVLPEPSGGIVMKLIRPSILDVWRHHTALLGPRCPTFYRQDGTTEVRQPSEESAQNRRRARLAAFASVRKVIARCRLQREERRKAGLPDILVQLDASDARVDAVEASIRAMVKGTSPVELAADALMELRFVVSAEPLNAQDDAVDWMRLTLLARLAPHLTGVLRSLVDDLVHGDASRTMSGTLIGSGSPDIGGSR